MTPETINAIRRDFGFTMPSLGYLLGVCENTVKGWEAGDTHIPVIKAERLQYLSGMYKCKKLEIIDEIISNAPTQKARVYYDNEEDFKEFDPENYRIFKSVKLFRAVILHAALDLGEAIYINTPKYNLVKEPNLDIANCKLHNALFFREDYLSWLHETNQKHSQSVLNKWAWLNRTKPIRLDKIPPDALARFKKDEFGHFIFDEEGHPETWW